MQKPLGGTEWGTQRIMNVSMTWKIMIITNEDKDYTGSGGDDEEDDDDDADNDNDDDDDDDDDIFDDELLSLKTQRGRS